MDVGVFDKSHYHNIGPAHLLGGFSLRLPVTGVELAAR